MELKIKGLEVALMVTVEALVVVEVINEASTMMVLRQKAQSDHIVVCAFLPESGKKIKITYESSLMQIKSSKFREFSKSFLYFAI